MGWELMPLEIGSKKLDGQVNINENNVEIEVPFFKGFKDSDTVKINKKSYTIKTATNVGGRDETILMTVKKEKNDVYKSDKSRKDT